jgi:hypothetical protein
MRGEEHPGTKKTALRTKRAAVNLQAAMLLQHLVTGTVLNEYSSECLVMLPVVHVVCQHCFGLIRWRRKSSLFVQNAL